MSKVVFGGAAEEKAALTKEEHDQATILPARVRAEEFKQAPKGDFRQTEYEEQTTLSARVKGEAAKESFGKEAHPHPGRVESVIPPRSGRVDAVIPPRAARPPHQEEEEGGQKQESELFPASTLSRRQRDVRLHRLRKEGMLSEGEGVEESRAESLEDADLAFYRRLPRSFWRKVVSFEAMQAEGLAYEEKTYLALGGGLGSFVWTDALLVSGVERKDIAVVGLEKEPHARYRALCGNSQIPSHECLRSNSESRPDCLWGFPSYALSECMGDLLSLRLWGAASTAWKMFAEPVAAETYTPRSGDVYKSIEREAKRIGWLEMLRLGRILVIRKTEDGRYAVLYSDVGDGRRRVMVGRFVHLALGYPGLRFAADLQVFRERYPDSRRVVNAYEYHEDVYQAMREKRARVILLRGRGIVASRVLQKLDEVRRDYGCDVHILHLMRSPKLEGNRYEKAKREVTHHWEYQPFNWPKSCWGGTYKAILEEANDEERARLLEAWGGTTTADRRDWQDLIGRGLREGWYRQSFGEVESVDLAADGRISTVIAGKSFGERLEIKADYVLDCTGLEDGLRSHRVMRDLLKTYELQLNPKGRLRVSNQFVVEGMEQEQGLLLASGAMTLGGPYAAVDSFLGLQYAALASLDALCAAKAPDLRRLSAWRSFSQWFRWFVGAAP